MKIIRQMSGLAKVRAIGWLSWFLLTGCQPSTPPQPTQDATPSARPSAQDADQVARNTDSRPARTASEATSPDTGQRNAAPAGEAKVDPVRRLVAAEELILELTPVLEPLQQDLLNLVLPTERSLSLFTMRAEIGDLVHDTNAKDTPPDRLAAGASRILPGMTADGRGPLWNELFRRVRFWEHVKLSIVKGHFTDDSWNTFRTNIALVGLARSAEGHWLDVRGSLEVDWSRDAELNANSTNADRPSDASVASETSWRIARWQPVSFTLASANDRQFRDVLAEAVPDESQRRSLIESQHWLYAINHYYPKRAARAESAIDDARFFPISTAYHPGLSVVDLDRDGWDDLYVVDRWGTNQLLINQRDGTFRSDAKSYGLDIEGRSNACVFADFDNDGDDDLMLARGMERSLYLVNENGRFVDRTADWISHPLPYEATSVSAADYNGDGLLDVYFATYHQDDISRRLDADLSSPEHRIHRTLTPEHSEELKRRFRSETHSFTNQVGPPNILLVNRGNGRFDLAPENPQVALWRNSFQATWCDFDQDGDPDLYVANDFAADHLLRNEGANGFRDVTLELGIDQLGFAMGATWGDYDNDGQHDLYVSNMYSKAGRRITQGVDQLDPRIAQLANGNYLYDFNGQRFQLVSGTEPPKLTVARAGWAWGGQFFDANNDGFLDLYVASGYYTVPAPYETKVDL